MSTVVELLRRRVAAQPAVPGYAFLRDGPEPTGLTSTNVLASLTYRELDQHARRVAAALADRGLAGRPVLLLHPPGLDYVIGFLGCLYASAIAVPAYPPATAQWHRSRPRLRALIADCGATTALTTAAAVPGRTDLAGSPELAGLAWLATDRLADRMDADGWQPPAGDPEAPALLQYTSGSTGAPRGVVLSHANLLHNAGLVQTGFGTRPGAVGVSWLPPYHDMGLIGGILQPLFAGFPVVLMSPLAFLRRPLTWLETIASTGATISGGPNFAYELCVRRTSPAQREALDLSRWRVAFCGAEPVRAATLDRFAEAFAPAGFRREAFYPCYGLAEATLIVTGGQPPRTAGSQVSCGPPLGGQRLAIADPATGQPRPPGAEGEIWLAGPSVARGYWGRPDETARTFGARLGGDPERRPYLRTGDLGYLDPAGELVVTGRIKDLIIVRGRNLHPADLEHAVEQIVRWVRPGGTAAFPVVRAGEERLGVAIELAPTGAGPDPAGVVPTIRQALAEAAGTDPATVVVLRPGRLPRTSSGKVRRYACREAFVAGDWDVGRPAVRYRWDEEVPAEPTPGAAAGPATGTAAGPAAGVAELVAEVLGRRPAAVPPDVPLTALGLDSVRAAELQAALATRGVDVSFTTLLSGATTEKLAGTGALAAPGPAASQASGAAPQLSEGQRALWLLHRWEPDSTAYQISRAARIRSPLDPEALADALAAAVVRHPALRTRLPARSGEPVAEVMATLPGPALARHDASGLDETELRARVQADADRPFDLATGPLFRTSLYTAGPDDAVLLLSLHHTITDFWSLSNLVDEVLAGYRAATRPDPGRPEETRASPAGVGPVAPPAEIEPRLAYWREALAGAPPELDLPTTFPGPRLQSFRGASHRFRLGAPVGSAVDRLATEAGVTRFAVLAAGFAAVLARYAAAPEVVVGAPAAGRRQPGQLGYQVDPVPLRIAVPPEGSFRELARTTGRTVAAALDQAVPFPRLVEELKPARDPGRPPIIQAMVVLLQPPSGQADLGPFAVADQTRTLRLGGLDVTPYPLVERGAGFDLSLTLAGSGEGLAGELTYATSRFDPDTAARMAGHFATLLARALAEPDTPLGTLALLDRAERAAVLAHGTGPAEAFPDRTTLSGWFARQAAARPDAAAVVAGQRVLSYRQLAERAGSLAALLAGWHGVRRGDLVGVHAPRGPEALVAFWGVLGSGAGYLPLPPDAPPDRLAWLIRDARPVVVATTTALVGQLPAGVPLVTLDGPLPALPPVADPAGPDDLAYALYTSGSTGHPKAVLLDHRGACNLAQAEIAGLAVAPASRLLQLASSGYDVHVSEILCAHLTGAALYTPPPEAAVPGQPLLDLLATGRITHAWMSPSLLAALPDADLPELSHILCGGEACPPEVVARWAPGRRFLNGYGPAETTVCATWQRCDPASGRRPPIGRPLPNVRIYLLDRRQQPVPTGLPGELYVGGAGVGWGYLRRPGLTAGRFLPDPYAASAGARMYRTGDLARWLPDGALDFLGRLDDQVQVRGVRVEPAEVAARLRELVPELREVAVVARPAAAGGDELVAYLVPGAGQPVPVVPELRGRLRAALPEALLPAAFVRLPALPLNRSGKLDRRALPAPALADRGHSGQQLPPRTELERVVAEVWTAALRVPAVGVRDHFFDELGGSSLLVPRVAGELSRRLAREVPVTWMFTHPTVEALARRLADSQPPTARPAGPAPEDRAARRRARLDQQARPTRERAR
jgi:amino acid adenylation domain-containing protein